MIALLLTLSAAKVSSQCIADFISAANGFTVAFTSTASVSQGSINAYNWDFGDGSVGTGVNPVHTFPFPGMYVVRHWLQTSAACGDTIVKFVFISAPSIVHVSLCPPSATDSLQAGSGGTTYQWQVSTDSINYTDINPGTNYSGTGTQKLKLVNIPSSFTTYCYRCLVDGSPEQTIYRLRFVNAWISTSGNWSNAANWSCGTLPDAATDVVVSSGTLTVDVNTTVKSLTVLANAAVIIQQGVTLTILQ